MSTKPTLLIFTRGADRESRCRHLLPPPHREVEQRLHQACLDSAIAAGRQSGLGLVVSSPSPLELPADVVSVCQRGVGFGDRLQTTWEAAWAVSSEAKILVGTDSPGLAAHHLRRATELLADDPDRVVIGPSRDGGFYLLAAARPLPGILDDIRWCCHSTLCSLRRALAAHGIELVELEYLSDLDDRGALERWLAAGRETRAIHAVLLASLARLLAALCRPATASVMASLPAPALGATTCRGPPP